MSWFVSLGVRVPQVGIKVIAVSIREGGKAAAALPPLRLTQPPPPPDSNLPPPPTDAQSHTGVTI
jgi:hypothetical protein